MPEPLGRHSFIDAAIKVLKEEKRPMKTKEIIEKALRKGLIKTHGKTPDQTLTGILNRIVKKESGVFKGHKITKVERGTFLIKEV